MEKDIRKLYAEYYFILKNGNHDEGVNLEIKTICFLNILNKKCIDISDLNLSDHKEFNKVMTRELSKQSNYVIKDILAEIIKVGVFNHRIELNHINKSIAQLDYATQIQLFDYEDLGAKAIGPLGNWSTSKNIINLITNLIDIKSYNSILDLCSGKGAFLAECAGINHDASLTGLEINQIAIVISKMRLIISNATFTIYRENILQTSLDTKYDLVFSDFPWSLRTSKDVVDDKKMIVEYRRNRMKADWNFVFKAINSMKKGGKAIVIVPQGALFNTPDINSRRQVINKGLLKTIIKLPSGTYPKSSVVYSILIFSYGNKSIKMVDASECIITKNSWNKSIDINAVANLIKSNDENKVKIVTPDQIKGTDYNLEVSRYLGSVNNLRLINPTPIKEIGTVLGGFQYTSRTVKELEPGEGNVDIVKITNIDEGEIDYTSLPSANIEEERIEKYLLRDNDIVISAKGTNIKIALVENVGERKIIPHNNLMVIRITSKSVLPGYVCNFLKSETGQTILKSHQTGSIIINITKRSLLDMNISILDMDTQETIVNRYNILKNKIIKLKERLNNLEGKLHSIYEDEVGD